MANKTCFFHLEFQSRDELNRPAKAYIFCVRPTLNKFYGIRPTSWKKCVHISLAPYKIEDNTHFPVNLHLCLDGEI